MAQTISPLTTTPARTAASKGAGSPESAAAPDVAPYGGKASPQTGEVLPARSAASAKDIVAAVERLNEILRTAERRVRFRIDDTSGRTVIFVVNAATGEIVRQIPPDEVLALPKRVGLSGSVIDAEV